MAKKTLLRLKVQFFYGGKWMFRVRLSGHGADQMSSRENPEENITKLEMAKSIAYRLENAVGLQKCAKPQARDSYIYFIRCTGEIFICNFIAVQPSADRKVNPELDMIVETYLRRSTKFFSRIRNSERDKCVTIFDDGSVLYGKHNEWFM